MVQSQLNTARLIAIHRIKDEMQRVRDKLTTTYQNLKVDNTIPNPIPKPKDMTNSQLEDAMQASQEVLANVMLIETAIRKDIMLLDNEKVSRQA